MKMYKVSFKSKFAARSYISHLKKYCNKDVISLLNLTQGEAEDKLIHFITSNKERGMAWGALRNYVAAVAKVPAVIFLTNPVPHLAEPVAITYPVNQTESLGLGLEPH